MTNFRSFALRIKTGKFSREINPILKIRNVIDISQNLMKHI